MVYSRPYAYRLIIAGVSLLIGCGGRVTTATHSEADGATADSSATHTSDDTSADHTGTSGDTAETGDGETSQETGDPAEELIEPVWVADFVLGQEYNGAEVLHVSPGGDIFVLGRDCGEDTCVGWAYRFSAVGDRIWSSYEGAPWFGVPLSLCANARGDAYVVQQKHVEHEDDEWEVLVALSRLDPAGQEQWSVRVAHTPWIGLDQALACRVEDDTVAIVGGETGVAELLRYDASGELVEHIPDVLGSAEPNRLTSLIQRDDGRLMVGGVWMNGSKVCFLGELTASGTVESLTSLGTASVGPWIAASGDVAAATFVPTAHDMLRVSAYLGDGVELWARADLPGPWSNSIGQRLTVDAQGRVYIVGRYGKIGIYDRDGNLRIVIPSDGSEPVGPFAVGIGATGHLLVAGWRNDKGFSYPWLAAYEN